MKWYYNGKLHREGGEPAVEKADGTKMWFYHGKKHREGGEPALDYADGRKEWYINGERHRENDLPALISPNGLREWYYNGKMHRMMGPARIPQNSSESYYFYGHQYEPDMYWQRIQLMTPEEPFTSDLSKTIDMAMEDTFDYEFQTEKQKREESLGRELTQQEQVELEDEVQQYIVQNVTDHMHEFRAEVMEREAPLMEELKKEYPPASRWAGRIHIT